MARTLSQRFKRDICKTVHYYSIIHFWSMEVKLSLSREKGFHHLFTSQCTVERAEAVGGASRRNSTAHIQWASRNQEVNLLARNLHWRMCRASSCHWTEYAPPLRPVSSSSLLLHLSLKRRGHRFPRVQILHPVVIRGRQIPLLCVVPLASRLQVHKVLLSI